MSTRTSRHLSLVPLAIAVVGLASSIASAQQTIIPPKPGAIEPASPLPAYMFGLLLAGIAIGLTVMPSKRSHED